MKPVPLSPRLLTTTHTCFLKPVGEKQQHVKNPELLLQPPPGPHHHLLVLLSSTPPPLRSLSSRSSSSSAHCSVCSAVFSPLGGQRLLMLCSFLPLADKPRAWNNILISFPTKKTRTKRVLAVFPRVSDVFGAAPCWGFLFKCIKQVQPHPLR